jgi:hypothetical protein
MILEYAQNWQILENIIKNSKEKSYLILGCVSEKLDDFNTNKNIIGALFPKIIFNGRLYDSGFVVLGLNEDIEIKKVDLNSLDIDFEIDKKSAFIFVDAFSKNIGEFMEEVYFNFSDITFIGGGAGSLDFVQRPVVFTNEGVFENAAVIGFLDKEIKLDVRHGWMPISEPMLVTKADKNILKELDYKNAFDVYKNILKTKYNINIDKENFFEIAKGYPFGIRKIDNEVIVRDPITINENNEIVLVGDISENSYVRILKGEKDNLINAAKEVSLVAKDKDITLFIDCISRVLFLEDDFQKEIDEVMKNSKNLIGALTLGEIASREEVLEFYNKTSVIGAFDA